MHPKHLEVLSSPKQCSSLKILTPKGFKAKPQLLEVVESPFQEAFYLLQSLLNSITNFSSTWQPTCTLHDLFLVLLSACAWLAKVSIPVLDLSCQTYSLDTLQPKLDCDQHPQSQYSNSSYKSAYDLDLLSQKCRIKILSCTRNKIVFASCQVRAIVFIIAHCLTLELF